MARWSCVFSMLSAVKKKGWGLKWVYRLITKKRKEFLLSDGVFLLSNLYINCNVRSCQYSTFVSVFHQCFHSLGGGKGVVPRVDVLQFFYFFLLYFYLKINFIHHPQCHFNLIQAKWLCTGIYFSTLGHNYIVLIAVTVFVDAVQLL